MSALAATATALELIEPSDRVAVALHPLRRRLLEHLREADSAAGLARKLSLPRQNVSYHLRELEKARLVEPVEERRRGNCVERLVRATARAYLISPEALGSLTADPDAIEDRFSSAYLIALAARLVAEVGRQRAAAEAAGKKLATLSLSTEVRFASAADRNAFAEELASAVARLAAKYHDEDAPAGRRTTLLVGAYPTPARQRRRAARREEDSP